MAEIQASCSQLRFLFSCLTCRRRHSRHVREWSNGYMSRFFLPRRAKRRSEWKAKISVGGRKSAKLNTSVSPPPTPTQSVKLYAPEGAEKVKHNGWCEVKSGCKHLFQGCELYPWRWRGFQISQVLLSLVEIRNYLQFSWCSFLMTFSFVYR